MNKTIEIVAQQNFVVFYSPGTLFAETTKQEIDEWDVGRAVEMARSVLERHAARPYGFCFERWGRTAKMLNSKLLESSHMYYLGGRVETIDEIRQRGLDSERTLLRNMETNGWDRVVTNTNSWRWTQPLHEGDVVLDVAMGRHAKAKGDTK